MSTIASVRADVSGHVLMRLQTVCTSRGLGSLAARLESLAALVQDDMRELEEELETLDTRGNTVERSACHLIGSGGKRLRPVCVALASRLGRGFTADAREMAVAVELVHNATLLHDDVVDLGDLRRGAPTARTIYGNAASVFAGDWLLVHALRRVRKTKLEDPFDRLLEVIEEMIAAEAVQLEGRGQLQAGRERWLRIAEGKTAALFRWAMFAGASAGGLDTAVAKVLSAYGLHLGVAFQVVDDLLDFAEDASATGKQLFTDLREGKVSYPLIVALEREPSLRELLVEASAENVTTLPSSPLRARIRAGLVRTDAFETSRAYARERSSRAIASLSSLPESRAKEALVTVAEATVFREM